MWLPRVSVGAYFEPTNDLTGVYMPADLGGNEQSWLGVLAQEVFEFRHTWAHLLSYLKPGNDFEADQEIRSHAVELAVAVLYDGRDYDAYRELMLTRLDDARAYRAEGFFKGMSRDDLSAQLQKYAVPAAAWMAPHRDFFVYWKAKHATA